MRFSGFMLAAGAAGVLGVLAVNLAADRFKSPGLQTFRSYLVGSR